MKKYYYIVSDNEEFYELTECIISDLSLINIKEIGEENILLIGEFESRDQARRYILRYGYLSLIENGR